MTDQTKAADLVADLRRLTPNTIGPSAIPQIVRAAELIGTQAKRMAIALTSQADLSEMLETSEKRIEELEAALKETEDNYETQLAEKDALLIKYEQREHLPSEIHAAAKEAHSRWVNGTREQGCNSFSEAFRDGFEAAHEDAQKRIADALALTPDKVWLGGQAIAEIEHSRAGEVGTPITAMKLQLAKAALLAAGFQEPERAE